MLTVVENFSFDKPKTKQCLELLSNFKLDGKKTLLVLDSMDANVILSARNLQKFKVIQAADINTIDVLNAYHVLLSEKSIPVIETTLSLE